MLKWFLLSFILLKVLVEIILKKINLSWSLRKDKSVPEALRDVIDEDSFKKSKSYLKDNTRISILQDGIHVLITMALILLIAPMTEQWSLRMSDQYLIQGWLFFGILFLIDYLFGLPFKIYHTFKLEQLYGFNRTSAKTFWLDEVKALIVGGIVGALLLTAILSAILHPVWWWRFFIIVLAFLLIAQWIAPIWIVPLFYKLSPLHEGDLRQRIEEFANQQGIPMKQIVVMNASSRSSKGNAAFAGIGSSQRLILFDTILNYPSEEILSIVAHEWGHRKHHHLWKQLIANLLTSLVIFGLANLFTLSRIAPDYFQLFTPFGHFYLALSFASPLYFFVEPLLSWWSRKHEFEADRFALDALKKTQASINSIKRLVKDNLSNINPHPLYSSWFYSHPSPAERIQAMHIVKGTKL